MVDGGARWAVPAMCLLLAAGLAGCASGPQEPVEQGSSVKTSIVDDADVDPKTAETKLGKVSGVVLHPTGFPLPGARITILSVDTSATTGADGAFAFQQVSAGEQLLRVEKETYQTLQQRIEVVAGKLTKVEVVLLPAKGTEGGFSEHFHDHWRGQDNYTLFEGQVEFKGETTQLPPSMCYVTYEAEYCAGHYLRPELDKIVPPGTSKVGVEITFEPGPLFDHESMYAAVYPPYEPGGQFYYHSQRIESGSTYIEYELPDPALVDHGHARWTSWQFYLSWSPATFQGYASTYYATGSLYNSLFRTPVDVKITAQRGTDLALDPPHARHWQDSDRIVMGGSEPSYAWCSVVPQQTCGYRYPSPSVSSYSGKSHCYYGCMGLEPGGVVPPGTTRVEFTVEHYWGTATAPQAAALFERTDFIIGYKAANAPPRASTWDHYTWLEPVATGETENGVTWTYEIDVTDEQTDPFYTKLSSWVLMAAIPGHEDANDWEGLDCGYEACGFAYFRLLEFIAINDDWDEMQAA